MSGKITKEALEANYLLSRILNNGAVDNSAETYEEVIPDEELDAVLEAKDEKPARKKKSSGGIKTTVGKGMGEKPNYLPDWDKAELPKSTTIDIFFPGHDIHYKEQLWPVPDRTITYTVELAKFAQAAYNCCESAGLSKDVCNKAKSGEIRVYDIKTFEDCKIEVKSLGCITVESRNGKIVKTLHLNEKGIKCTSLDINRVNKKLTELMNSFLVF